MSENLREQRQEGGGAQKEAHRAPEDVRSGEVVEWRGPQKSTASTSASPTGASTARASSKAHGFDPRRASGGAAGSLARCPTRTRADEGQGATRRQLDGGAGVEPAPTLTSSSLAAVTRRKDAATPPSRRAAPTTEAARCYTDALAIAEACRGTAWTTCLRQALRQPRRLPPAVALCRGLRRRGPRDRARRASSRRAAGGQGGGGLGDVDAAQRALADALDEPRLGRCAPCGHAVVRLAKSGTDTVLTELDGLTTRLGALPRQGHGRGGGRDLQAVPSLLAALMGGRGRGQHRRRQVRVCAQRLGASLLPHADDHPPSARRCRRNRRSSRAARRDAAAAFAGCPSNQLAFDKYVPQLVPLLRAKSSLPFEILKAAVKVVGAMASRAAARRIFYDPESRRASCTCSRTPTVGGAPKDVHHRGDRCAARHEHAGDLPRRARRATLARRTRAGPTSGRPRARSSPPATCSPAALCDRGRRSGSSARPRCSPRRRRSSRAGPDRRQGSRPRRRRRRGGCPSCARPDENGRRGAPVDGPRPRDRRGGGRRPRPCERFHALKIWHRVASSRGRRSPPPRCGPCGR